MKNVKTMLECWILATRNLYEIFDKRVLGNSKGLCYDDIVSFREEREGKLHEIQASRLIHFINTEQINNDCISCSIGNLR
jgi:hypothetical protein